MKRIRFTHLLLMLVIAGVVGGIVYVGWNGVSAREKPGVLETFIARRIRRIATPRLARSATNPVPPGQQVLTEAMEHFADHCAFCHANDGSGNTPIGNGLYPKTPDMRLPATQSLTDGELFYIIQNGVRFTGMPGFGTSDGSHDEDSWKLVRFIRHLPDITDEELAQMKQLNPKSPADLKEEEDINKFLEGGDDATSTDGHRHH